MVLHFVKRVKIFLLSINIIYLVALFVGLGILMNYFFYILPFTESSDVVEINNYKEEWGPVGYPILLLVVAPLVETLIFKTLVINLSSHLLKRANVYSPKMPVLISAVLFALIHTYNITYVIVTFFAGLLLAILYVIMQKRKENAFLGVSLAHSLHNLYWYILDFII